MHHIYTGDGKGKTTAAATRETRTSIVTTLLLVLEEVEKEDADGK